MLFVKHACHRGLFYPDQRTIRHRGRRRHAQGLTCETTLAKEITSVQNSHDRFFALFGRNRQLHLSVPKEEHGIGRISLPEDVAFSFRLR